MVIWVWVWFVLMLVLGGAVWWVFSVGGFWVVSVGVFWVVLAGRFGCFGGYLVVLLARWGWYNIGLRLGFVLLGLIGDLEFVVFDGDGSGGNFWWVFCCGGFWWVLYWFGLGLGVRGGII